MDLLIVGNIQDHACNVIAKLPCFKGAAPRFFDEC
jgi:hypothetical protein